MPGGAVVSVPTRTRHDRPRSAPHRADGANSGGLIPRHYFAACTAASGRNTRHSKMLGRDQRCLLLTVILHAVSSAVILLQVLAGVVKNRRFPAGRRLPRCISGALSARSAESAGVGNSARGAAASCASIELAGYSLPAGRKAEADFMEKHIGPRAAATERRLVHGVDLQIPSTDEP